MSKYYFFFPKETNLDYIQPVKAKNIHQAWEIMNFFFKRFRGYGYTRTQLEYLDEYDPTRFLPILTISDVKEALNERYGSI